MIKMKELTMKDIQTVSLNILKDFHDFCIKNDIKYTVAAGTMLGAIRHKGFIPWDDDIDIFMTRPEYDKFNKLYKSSKGYKKVSKGDKECILEFTRVYDCDKTKVVNVLKNTRSDSGVWIDILPLDAVPKDVDDREAQFMSVYQLYTKICEYRYILAQYENASFKYKLRLLYRKAKWCLRNGSINSIIKKIDDVSMKYRFGSTKYCAYLTSRYALGRKKLATEIYETSWFSEYEEVQFEDTTVLISKDYHKILTAMYGDYMQLPPVEKRVAAHGQMKFYWK